MEGGDDGRTKGRLLTYHIIIALDLPKTEQPPKASSEISDH